MLYTDLRKIRNYIIQSVFQCKMFNHSLGNLRLLGHTFLFYYLNNFLPSSKGIVKCCISPFFGYSYFYAKKCRNLWKSFKLINHSILIVYIRVKGCLKIIRLRREISLRAQANQLVYEGLMTSASRQTSLD